MSIVHGGLPSPFVRKVCVVLEEKQVPYRIERLSPFPKTDALMALSPLGKIPIYEDENGTLPDSSAIAGYLEKAHPNAPLFPEAPFEFARALWFEEYGDTRVVETAGGVFFERVLNPRVFQQPTDEARVAELLDDALPPVFAYLEESLGDREFLVGDRFSIADIAICSPLVNFQMAGADVDAARFPAMAKYLSRVLSRPSFEKLRSEEARGIG